MPRPGSRSSALRFEPLPGPRVYYASYHPPLSCLVARLLYVAYPHEIEVSQMLSTGAAIGALVALRGAVAWLGCLRSVLGIVFVYGTMSIPVIVWMAVETSYDALVLFWFFLTLKLSVRLLWSNPDGRPVRTWLYVNLLGLSLGAGLLTKFTGLLAFAVPLLVVLVRDGRGALSDLFRRTPSET